MQKTDTFKRLRSVIKDVNGDNRQIIKTMQDQIDYLMEFIDIQGETLKRKLEAASRNFLWNRKSDWLTVVKNSMNFCWGKLRTPLLRQRL